MLYSSKADSESVILDSERTLISAPALAQHQFPGSLAGIPARAIPLSLVPLYPLSAASYAKLPNEWIPQRYASSHAKVRRAGRVSEHTMTAANFVPNDARRKKIGSLRVFTTPAKATGAEIPFSCELILLAAAGLSAYG